MPASVVTSESTVSPGARILHIGPHKTGTTSLQAAAAAARPELRRHGVLYPGSGHNHTTAANGALGQASGWLARSGASANPTSWTTLVQEVDAAPERALVSSELFCEAAPGTIERIVNDLGGPRTHVVVTLRSMRRILPSAWVQGVKGGLRRPYADWLRDRLSAPRAGSDGTFEGLTTFWLHYDHAALLERWVAVVGADNLSVVVLDGTDHASLPHTFESLLGVPAGTLRRPGTLHRNRSLTAAEAEMVRLINETVRGLDVNWEEYGRLIRLGAVRRMADGRFPGADEPRVSTPRWAADAARALDEDTISATERLGVRLLGSPETLRSPVDRRARHDSDPVPTEKFIPVEAAAEAVLGAVAGALSSDAWFGGDPRTLAHPRRRAPVPPVHARPVSTLTTRELAGQLRLRLTDRLRTRPARRSRER